ncbi:MAG: MiaB/RimO family radical SAM methylthiotransferase, partial [Pseudomonadota bacterium]|nr:MiaB/RimO family radical SAM methylthiotransferase [Pseudomonadota bacterium]
MLNKRVHIETWGCQMNVADSERILSLLAKEQYKRATSEHDASLIVLNTCHIRAKAKHKVISRLGQLRNLKSNRQNLKIAVVGCVAQAEGKKLIAAAPYVDYVLGPSKLEQLPALLKQDSAVAVGFKDANDVSDTTASPALSGRQEVSRFLNIMQGCNNYCTFCVVPFTRGPEKSVAMPILVAQAQSLLATGAKEITLLGQNVNSYGNDLEQRASNPFVELLYTIGSLPNLQRLRFTTSNPHDFSAALVKCFADVPTLGRYTHLPVQSGSDVILQKMRRKTNVA